MKYVFDWKEYARVARKAVAEGCVLLRNEENTLPIKKNEKVSIFGRIQFDYYKSGTGSGGMVNAPYVVSILDALKADEDVIINQNLLRTYQEWVETHPFNRGKGWAMEPWCQDEMKVTEQMVQSASKESDLALVIIGRTAGEDKDNSATKGSYLLTDLEEEMLRNVCKLFKKVAVVLNVGNIIDMKFVEKYHPQAVLYAWQGGMEGGNGVVDVLTGKVNPSGKLTDTIAHDISDYPSTKDFGDKTKNYYTEDIYVGYRYFETAAKDKALYPFGFGLSYTKFSHRVTSLQTVEKIVRIEVEVKNIGIVSGKEVIQVYYCPPQGKLCKPTRNLIRFCKTDLIAPENIEILTFSFPIYEMASFDDNGYTGNCNCNVLEVGKYSFFVGSDVRQAKEIGNVIVESDIVTQRLTEACAPVLPYNRMKILVSNNKVNFDNEPVPQRRIDLQNRIITNCPMNETYKGDECCH